MRRNRDWARLPSVPALLAGLGLLVVAAFAGTSVAVGAIGGSTTTYSSSTSSTTDTSTSSTTDTSTSTETTTTTTETTTTTTPPPPPPGGQGCTPGFWKNHPDAFATTPYSPTTTLGSVFTGLSPSYASLTFAQALNLGSGGLNALLRHAVAALLNASSSEVDYPLSAAQVIAMTNAAIASGNYEPTKNLFDAANNLETPGFCD